MEKSEIRLADFLKLIRDELKEYVKTVNKKEPIIAVLNEVTITMEVSKVNVAEGGFKIVVAELGAERTVEKTHTITLKFIVPSNAKLKSFDSELQSCPLIQRQLLVPMGEVSKRKKARKR